MKKNTLFPLALLIITLSASGAAHSNDLYNDSPKSAKETHGDYHPTNKLWAKLPQEKRKILQDAMAQAHKQNEPLREEIKKQGKELDALLVAPDFDKNAYLNKNAKLGALHAKVRANMSDAFASVLGQFTPEERKILAKLHEIRHHHHDHGEWYHDEHTKEWSHHHGEESNHKPQAE